MPRSQPWDVMVDSFFSGVIQKSSSAKTRKNLGTNGKSGRLLLSSGQKERKVEMLHGRAQPQVVEQMTGVHRLEQQRKGRIGDECVAVKEQAVTLRCYVSEHRV